MANGPLKNRTRAANGLLTFWLRCGILNKSDGFASGSAPCQTAKILVFACAPVSQRAAKRWTTYLGIALTAVTLVACAAKKPETSVTWKKSDGSTATAEELERAATACHEANRATRGDDTGRFATVEWAANMLDCMKERGFFRVEGPLP